jgi:DNA-binding transcriptional regulator YiaG
MKPHDIKALRESLGMTQDDLARYLGLATKGAVSRMESGGRAPTGPVLRLLLILRQTGGKLFQENPRTEVDSGQP